MTGILLPAILGLDVVAIAIALGVRPPLGRRVALGLLAIGGILAATLGGFVLAGSGGPGFVLDTGLPTGALHVSVDPLGALFLILAGLLTAAAAVYADGYLAHTDAGVVRAHVAVFALLVAAIVSVLVAADGVAFLFAWEVLAWSAYLAVILDIDDPRVGRAAFLMLAVSELGTAALLAAFVVLGANGFTFPAMIARGEALDEPVRSLVFWALVLGFGAKAGIMPLQLWLPEAHPAAPSHVSALLSAIIVELGLYGIVRFAFAALPTPEIWWGPALTALGAVTAAVAILWALLQNDIKRVLAYSTIENVGLIVAALGLSETFRAAGLAVLAALALVAALYHVSTHAFGKGVLFLAAGSVDHGTGTRDLDRLGGLTRPMPVTSVSMLLGVLSVAAIAPFAGFLSEWMILETFLQSPAVPLLGSRLVLVAAGAVLALTAATAVLAFARLFATGFVGRPRSRGAHDAVEAPRSMRFGMALLLGPLLAIGVLPALALPLVDRAAAGVVGPSVAMQLIPPLFGNAGPYAALVAIGGATFRGLLPGNGLVIIPAPGLSTIVSPTYLVLFEAGFVVLTALGVRAIRRLGRDRRAPAWGGGMSWRHPAAQYTATAYANPLRLIFAALFRSKALLSVPDPAASGGSGALEYEQQAPPPLERELYAPLLRSVSWFADKFKVLQSGDTNAYVGYILLVVVLIVLLRVL